MKKRENCIKATVDMCKKYRQIITRCHFYGVKYYIFAVNLLYFHFVISCSLLLSPIRSMSTVMKILDLCYKKIVKIKNKRRVKKSKKKSIQTEKIPCTRSSQCQTLIGWLYRKKQWRTAAKRREEGKRNDKFTRKLKIALGFRLGTLFKYFHTLK